MDNNRRLNKNPSVNFCVFFVLLSLLLSTVSFADVYRGIGGGGCGGLCEICLPWAESQTCDDGFYEIHDPILNWVERNAYGLSCGVDPVCWVCDKGGFYIGNGYCSTACPSGTVLIDGQCVTGTQNLGESTCDDQPSTGNPILVSIGNKYQSETDYAGSGSFPLSIRRYYNSETGKWQFNYSEKLWLDQDQIYLIWSDGKAVLFNYVNGAWQSSQDQALMLEYITDSEQWRLKDKQNKSYLFNTKGNLISVTNLSGIRHTLVRNSWGRIESVTHSFGGTLDFIYNDLVFFTGISTPDDEIYQYDFEDEELIRVTYPDGDIRNYHYEDTRFPHALTGITDENGNRYATWSYDSQGRAISSEHANGVDKVTLAYNADGTTTVTNPLGKQTTYHFTTIHGVRKVTQVEGHPTASCEGANKSYSYDANGNVISKTDWKGVVTNYTYDMARNLELTRTKAVGTPQERTITTEWHTDFRLPTKIIEPGKITEYTYDTQGRQLSSKVSSVQ